MSRLDFFVIKGVATFYPNVKIRIFIEKKLYCIHCHGVHRLDAKTYCIGLLICMREVISLKGIFF